MDIVVIGAGLSGLTAAASLREAGASVQVIEASTMIGGRIQALRDPDDNRALADLGPTWVWPKYQPVAARWLERLGVDTFDQFNDGDAILEGYAPTVTRQPLPGQEGIVRMIGGPSALIEALADSIGFANIRVSAKAVGVSEQGKQHASVLLSTGEILTARRVSPAELGHAGGNLGHLIIAVHLGIARIGAQPIDRPSLDLARRKDQVHQVASMWGSADKPLRAGRCQRQDRDPRWGKNKSAREGVPLGAILR